MRKKSDFIKRRNSIMILHWISLGTVPENSLYSLQPQIGILAKAGYVKINPGRNYELTAKGRARESLYSDDPKIFDANVKKLLADKMAKSQVFNPGTMPMFYKGCTLCETDKLEFEDWVKWDRAAIQAGTERPERPVFKKHKH